MLNIICLDFWNTMYENIPQNPKRTYIYNLIYNSFNKKISTNKIISLLNEFDKSSNNIQYSNFDRLSYIEEKCQVYLTNNEKSKLDLDISNSIIKFPPILNQYVTDFLVFCQKNFFKIILISDTNYSYGCSIRQILKADNIFNCFDYLIFSDETKVRKPNNEIFEKVCKKYNCTPKNCLFIGDSEKKDINGPKTYGFYTAKKCTFENIKIDSNADIKFTCFSDLIKEFIEGGIFYGK